MTFIDRCLVLALALSTEVHAGVIHLSAGDSTLPQSHPTATSHTPRKLPPLLSSLLPPLPPPLPSRLPPLLSSLLSLPSSLHLPIPSSIPIHFPSTLPIHFPSPLPIHFPSTLPIHFPSTLPIHFPSIFPLPLPLPTLPIPSVLPIPSTLPVPVHISSIFPLPVHISSIFPLPTPIPTPTPPPFPPTSSVHSAVVPLIPTIPTITTSTLDPGPLLHAITSPFGKQTPPSHKAPFTQGVTANQHNKGPPKATPVDPPHTDPPPTSSPQVNPPHTDQSQVNPPHTDQLQVNPPHTDSPHPPISETSPNSVHPSGLHSPLSLKVSATINVQSEVSQIPDPDTVTTPSPTPSLPASNTATAPSGSGAGSRPFLGTTTTPSTPSIHSIHPTPTPLPTPLNKPHMVHIIGGAIGGSLLLLISLLLVLLLLRRRRQRDLEATGGHTASEARHQPQLALVDRILRSLHISSTTTNITPFHKPAFLRSSRGFTRIRDDDDDEPSFHATGSPRSSRGFARIRDDDDEPSFHATDSPSRESAHVFSSQSANASASELDSPQTTLVEAHSGVNHGRRGKWLRNSYARNARGPSFLFRYRNYLSVQNPSSSQDLQVASTSSRPVTIRDQSTDSMVQTTSRGPPSLLFTSSDVAADTSTESGHLTTQWFTTSSDSMQSLSSERTSRRSLP